MFQIKRDTDILLTNILLTTPQFRMYCIFTDIPSEVLSGTHQSAMCHVPLTVSLTSHIPLTHSVITIPVTYLQYLHVCDYYTGTVQRPLLDTENGLEP